MLYQSSGPIPDRTPAISPELAPIAAGAGKLGGRIPLPQRPPPANWYS